MSFKFVIFTTITPSIELVSIIATTKDNRKIEESLGSVPAKCYCIFVMDGYNSAHINALEYFYLLGFVWFNLFKQSIKHDYFMCRRE